MNDRLRISRSKLWLRGWGAGLGGVWLVAAGLAQADGGSNGQGAEPDSPRASYRVQLTQAEIDSWSRSREGAPFMRGQAALDSLVLAKVLAERARLEGLHLQPRVRLDLLAMHGREARYRLRQEVTASVEVDPAAIDTYLADNPIRDRPRRVRVRNLFRRFGSDAPERGDLQATMEGYRRQVLEGTDFADLARRVSESETRWRGGLMGNVRPGSLGGGDLERLLFSMEPGEVSPVLKTQGGLTLFFCEDVLDAVVFTEAERREAASNRLWRQIFDRRWKSLIEHLRSRGAMEVDRQEDGSFGLRYTGGYLNPMEVAQLVGHGAADMWPEEVPDPWQAAFEGFVVGQMARLYQVEQNWRHSPEVTESLLWEERQRLASAYLARRVGWRFEEPSDAQIEDSYRLHRQRYLEPEKWHLSVIQLPRRPDHLQADTTRAARLLGTLRDGETTFEEAASDHSTHASGRQRGAIPPISKSRLAARLGIDLARAARSLTVGEVSELVASGDHWWILQLREIADARPATLEEAWERVRRQWIEDRLDALQVEVVEEILEGLQIEVEGAEEAVNDDGPR